MRRIIVALFAVGLAAGPAAAQELELKPPKLQAKARCTPELQARCAGLSQQRAVDKDLACESCTAEMQPSAAQPSAAAQPGEPARGVSSPAKTDRPLWCTMSEMPLSPTAPGCLRPPIDAVPVP